MGVPLLDVNAQNLPLEDELTDVFQSVLRSGRFILGEEVAKFEEEVAAFVGAEYGIGVSSGTDAILLALMALDIGVGDEVICPAFTFFATAGCISRTGATPVFVDSCPVCFNLDLDSVRAKITDKTKAIVPVHLFGQSAEMDGLMAIAAEHGLKVIEDGAQAIGSKYKGRGCGTIGDFGTYSFFPSKNLGGFGDGGMLVTNDGALAEKSRVMRMHGSKPKYYHHYVGGNFRIDALQAALLRVKLRRYADYTEARRANAAFYTAALSALSGVVLGDESDCCCAAGQAAKLAAEGAKIVLPVAYGHNEHIWNQYTLRVLGEGRREAMREHLSGLGIGCEIYYPVTMDEQVCFADLPAASRSGVEVAHQLAGEVISIPIYGELSGEQRDEVVAAVGSFVEI
ncbi:MAG: DegT/DnrJ/EryC1/StrS family aminotransferase [Verrucomicrobiales bacterium]|nr:DegT/DnrJ/EryC1/StrS family aminotransferase [Verrucomicrobiales bacterium]